MGDVFNICALVLSVMAAGGMFLFLDDHSRKNYRPHSAALYGLNVLVNIVPGMVLYPIVATCLIFPGLQRYVPYYIPWINVGLEELPLEERGGEYPQTDDEVGPTSSCYHIRSLSPM